MTTVVKVDYKDFSKYTSRMSKATPDGYAEWVAGVRARLRAVREEKGLTYRAAHAATGVHFGNISRTEAGRVEPTLSLLFALAKGYGVPVAYLLCGGVQDPDPPPDSPAAKPRRPKG